MRKLTTAIVWIVSFFAGSSGLVSQSTQPADTEPVNISINFSIFPVDSGDWEGIHYSPAAEIEDDAVLLRFNRLQRTGNYAYSGPSDLIFYREQRTPDGAETMLPIGFASIPSGVSDAILFFRKQGAGNQSIQVTVMEDGEAGFPNESLVFFNTTNVTFHGVLGRQTMTVPPGISGPFDLTQYFDSPVPIGLVVRDGDESHDVLLNRMRFYPGRRTVALLLLPKDPNSKRIRLRRLTELVQKEAYGVEEIQMADPAD